MGKIEELFGVQSKDVVDKLPNEALKKSIASGNYGRKTVNNSFDNSNRLFRYLVCPGNKKNISYWYSKVIHDDFCWEEMSDYFKRVSLLEEGGFHPWDYGLKGNRCRVGVSCDDCHGEAIKILYEYYRKYKEAR